MEPYTHLPVLIEYLTGAQEVKVTWNKLVLEGYVEPKAKKFSLSVLYNADNTPPIEEVGIIEGTSGETSTKFGDTNIKAYVRMEDNAVYGELTVGILQYTGNVIIWKQIHPPEAVVGVPVQTMVMSFIPGGKILDDAFKYHTGITGFSANTTYNGGETSDWHVHDSDTNCTVTNGKIELEVIGSIRNVKIGGIANIKGNIAKPVDVNSTVAIKSLMENSPMAKSMLLRAPQLEVTIPDAQIGITSTGKQVTKVELTAGQMVSIPSGMIHRFGSKDGGSENHKYVFCSISPIKPDFVGDPVYFNDITLAQMLPVLIHK